MKVAAFTKLKVSNFPQKPAPILPISMGDISEHYSSWEFVCPGDECLGQDRGRPSTRLLAVLEGLRALVGRPIHITSGYRCPRHNAAVGGVSPSEHTGDDDITNAADIACLDSRERHELLRALFTLKVERIGIGKNFIHVGVSQTLPAPSIWAYYA